MAGQVAVCTSIQSNVGHQGAMHGELGTDIMDRGGGIGGQKIRYEMEPGRVETYKDSRKKKCRRRRGRQNQLSRYRYGRYDDMMSERREG